MPEPGEPARQPSSNFSTTDDSDSHESKRDTQNTIWRVLQTETVPKAAPVLEFSKCDNEKPHQS